MLAKHFGKEVSRATVQRVLKADGLKPWREKMWCIPTLHDEFRARMFDLLDLYEKPHDALLPIVCLDEKTVELHDERSAPIRSKSGTRRDYEYIRKRTGNLFVLTEPKGGKHYVRVTKRRTRKDFAHCLKWLSRRYPDAVTIHRPLHAQAWKLAEPGGDRDKRHPEVLSGSLENPEPVLTTKAGHSLLASPPRPDLADRLALHEVVLSAAIGIVLGATDTNREPVRFLRPLG